MTQDDTPVPKSSLWDRTKKAAGTRAFKIVLMILMVALVAFIMSRTIKINEVTSALSGANIWWILAAGVAAGLTWVGSAIPLQAFSRLKVPFWDAFVVQVAASFVGVVAPAGLGPMGLHLRYLTKRGMNAAAASAVVILIEIAQIGTSTVLLLVSLLIDHDFPHLKISGRTVTIVVVAVVAVVVIALFIPKVRTRIKRGLSKYWADIQPELQWVKGRPTHVAYGIGGVILQTSASALALYFCLLAVGHPTSFLMAISVYLIGSTIGSAVPTPGGIGSTLGALVGALHLAGVPAAAALSAAVLFRLVSFYIQVPLGWIGFEIMQRRNMV